MTQILKFLNLQQLLKRILRASSCLGRAIAILWVRPLYFSALQMYALYTAHNCGMECSGIVTVSVHF